MNRWATALSSFVAGITFSFSIVSAADVTDAQLRALLDQNSKLQQQVLDQQRQIDELRARLDDFQGASRKSETRPAEAVSLAGPAQEVRIMGEAGLAFFRTGPEGQFPNSEFRIDDAKVYLGAPVWKNAFFFGEFQLTTRETVDENLHVGELYVDLERLAAPWGQARLLNLRMGRLNIPFGEEYLSRGVLDNPLISHSVSDLWGIDEGVELYGEAGGVHYVAAVQNGGNKALHDYTSSKAVAGRLSYNPLPRLHLSASAMRTGQISTANDGMSALWIGGGFFRALGGAATTQNFSATLYEGDASVRWTDGGLKGAVGQARFDDDDTTAHHSRTLHYYYVEAVQRLVDKLHGAIRFSAMTVARGYPLVGLGDFGDYFFRSPLTDKLQRLSVGLDYRFGPPLIWKVEYAREQGHLVNGVSRDDEDLLASEIALKF